MDQLLELARWTGSAGNSQPWEFVVVRDPDIRGKLAGVRPPIGWAAAAPVAIAIVLGKPMMPMFDAYDEGRVTERLLTGATLLGYGGGTAWYGDPQREAEAKRILGVPESLTARQFVAIGRPEPRSDAASRGSARGRKPLRELVSYDRYGSKTR